MQTKTILGWSSILLRTVSLILLIPVAMESLSSEDFLFWQLMQTFVLLGIALDFGLTPTFSRYFAYANGAEKSIKSNQLNQLYATLDHLIIKRLVPIILALALIGYATLHEKIAQQPDYPMVFWAYAILVTLQIMVNSRIGLLVGIDQIELSRVYEIIFNIIQISALCAAMVLTQSLLVVVVVHVISLIIGWSVLCLLVRRQNIVKGEINSQLQDEITNATYKTGLGIMLSQVVLQAPPLVLVGYVEPELLSEYLILMRIMQVICQLSNVFIYQSMPQINALQEVSAWQEQCRLVKDGLYKTSLSFYLMSCAAWLILPYLFPLVTQEYHFNSPLFFGLVVMFACERLLAIFNQLESVKKYINWAFTYTLSLLVMLCTVISVWIYTGGMSLNTLIIATTVGYLISVIGLKLPKLRTLYSGLWKINTIFVLFPLILLGFVF